MIGGARAAVESQHSILVIEDEPGLRRALVRLLAAVYVVHAAGDADEAMGLLRAGLRPTAILLDLTLPGMRGTEFVGILEADRATAGIPVVVLSGLAADVHRGLSVAAYVQKPFSNSTLMVTLASVVSAGGRVLGGA